MCGKYTTFVAISYVPKQQPIYEFGVCVANGYGSQPAEEFVEWMELLLLYGVSEVNLYDTSFVNMSELFRYYEKNGVLLVRKLPHPLPTDENWERKVRNLRTVTLNDCMLRNMYRYRYVVVFDFDEMIVPRQHVNYSVMITQINARLNLSQPYHSYSFVNVFFLKDFPSDPAQSLKTMRYRYRTHHNVPYYASKSFVSPLSCFNLMNHYCYKPLPGYAGGDISKFAPVFIGANHHYRTCGKFNGLPCERLLKEKTTDDIMLRVRDRIMERVRPVLKALGHVL